MTCLTFPSSHLRPPPQSSDSTVFFFSVGEKYNPIGFVHVPGPVQALEWSPHSHVSLVSRHLLPNVSMRGKTIYSTDFCAHFTQSESRLLILCQSGHVVEVHSPDPEAQRPTETFQLPDLPSLYFRFRSIKSQIQVWVLSVLDFVCKLLIVPFHYCTT